MQDRKIKNTIGILISIGGYGITLFNLIRYLLLPEVATEPIGLIVGFIYSSIALLSIFVFWGGFLQAFVLFSIAGYAMYFDPGDFFAVGFFVLASLLCLQYGYLHKFFYLKVILLVVIFSAMQFIGMLHTYTTESAFISMFITMIYITVFLFVVSILFNNAIHIYTKASLFSKKGLTKNRSLDGVEDKKILIKLKELDKKADDDYKEAVRNMQFTQLLSDEKFRRDVRRVIHGQVVQNISASLIAIERFNNDDKEFIKKSLLQSVESIRSLSFDLLPDEIDQISLMAGIREFLLKTNESNASEILWIGDDLSDFNNRDENYIFYLIFSNLVNTIIAENYIKDFFIKYENEEICSLKFICRVTSDKKINKAFEQYLEKKIFKTKEYLIFLNSSVEIINNESGLIFSITINRN